MSTAPPNPPPISGSADPLRPAEPQPAAGLGQATARGFAWFGLQSVAERITTLLGMIALYRLLGKANIELVALTYTVTSFVWLMQSSGLREVLQRRQKRIDVWVTPAFWLSVSLGLVIGLLQAAVAFPVASFYNEPAVGAMLIVAAAAYPASAAGIVPEAILRSRLEFRRLATIGTVYIVGLQIIAIGLAVGGLGAMSIIIAQPAMALVRAVLLWRHARPRLRHGPRPGRWRYLMGDSLSTLVGNLAMMTTYQGPAAILRKMTDPLANAAGLYYTAVNTADQSVRMLVNNLAGVLLPVLSRMQDEPERKARAFLNALSLQFLVGVPVCVLQAIVARPMIHVAFGDSWLEVAPILSIVSVAAIGRLAFGPCEPLLWAQGRFGAYTRLAVIYAACFLTAVITATHYYGLMGCAVAAGVCLLVMGPIALKISLSRLNVGWGEIWRTVSPSLICSAIAAAPAAAIVLLVEPSMIKHGLAALHAPPGVAEHATILADLLAGGGATAAFGIVYLLLIRKLGAEGWNQLVTRLSAVLPAPLRSRLPRLFTEPLPR